MLRWTYMKRHILQTFIKAGKHFRELFAPDKVSCTRRGQSPCDWLKVVVVFEVVLKLISQTRDPLLLAQQTLALLLKGRSLCFDFLERVC